MPGSAKDTCATAAGAQCLAETAIPGRGPASILVLAARFQPQMEKQRRPRESEV